MFFCHFLQNGFSSLSPSSSSIKYGHWLKCTAIRFVVVAVLFASVNVAAVVVGALSTAVLFASVIVAAFVIDAASTVLLSELVAVAVLFAALVEHALVAGALFVVAPSVGSCACTTVVFSHAATIL